MKKYFSVAFLLLVLLAIILTSDPSVKVMKRILNSDMGSDDKKLVIVIDPGHGGRDPGKVGVNNTLEKDINLIISKKLQNLLELNDFKVIMTREEDEGLYSQEDSSKKRADLENRIKIINSNTVNIAISIHQNSFSDGAIKGAQVFYYGPSAEGKKLAETIQTQIVKTIADGNHRKAKSNSSYYMLKKSECPLVIVECGYLSNAKEEELLLKDDYQEKMAWAIHLAILQFINSGGLEGDSSKAVTLK